MKIINTSNINEARKLIQERKKEKQIVIVQAQDEEFNRKILENPDVDILLSPELHNRKDKLKQRDSGLNEILCRLAKKNSIKIAIDLDKTANLQKKEKAVILARIMQNIVLCRKTKTQIILLNTYKQNNMSFFLALKSSSEQAKNSFFKF